MTAPPMGVCTACGHFVWSNFLVDQPCHQRYDGNRCKGVTSGAAHFIFKECPDCRGTGNKCRRCQGERLVAEPVPVV